MFTYPAKITKDGDFYLVAFRDFYGEEPVTQGSTYEEAEEMAADWLVSEALIALESKGKMPTPSKIEEGDIPVEMPIEDKN